jgi:hypothetical protein
MFLQIIWRYRVGKWLGVGYFLRRGRRGGSHSHNQEHPSHSVIFV